MHKSGQYRTCKYDAYVDKSPNEDAWKVKVYISQGNRAVAASPPFFLDGIFRNIENAMVAAIEYAKRKIDDGTAFYR